MNITQENSDRFTAFVVARHGIFEARAAGQQKPWTQDPILQRYRFCNVYRELDTVTKWLSDNWRTPLAGHPDMWFAMSVARWVNWPDTLQELDLKKVVLPWNPKRFIEILKDRRDAGAKVWTGAYMIGTQGNAMDKVEFIANGVLTPLWEKREELRPKTGDLLARFAHRVIAVKNQGKFMVGQMVADAKYADPILLEAPDWGTWAVSGPGSRRGLNRVTDRPLDKGWNEGEFLETLGTLRSRLNAAIPPWMPDFHAQDVQNCLCEFDKYERVRLGQGKPRSGYPGVGPAPSPQAATKRRGR